MDAAPRGPRVRPELGPTLPALLRGRSPRARRALLTAAGLLVLAAVALAASAGSASGEATLLHRSSPAFTLVHDPEVVRRVAPRPGELARLEAGRPGLGLSVVVRPLRLPAYRGEPETGLLPLVADRRETALRRSLPRFRLRESGKARVRDAPGYQLAYRSGPPGRRTATREVLLVPDVPGVREGVVLSFRRTARGPLDERDRVLVAAARSAFRSFQFGLERD